MTRKIYYIPMVHVKEELGELQEPLAQAHRTLFGMGRTEVFFKEIENYWKSVVQRIEKAGLQKPEIATGLHVFVDSLPNGKEELVQKTVRDLIASGKIPVYQIIAKLQVAGARVHGTENIKWLIQEASYWKGIWAGKRTGDPEFEKESLENRDQAIIERINEVVPDGEIALVFIGRAHNVVGPLSKPPYNFEVINL